MSESDRAENPKRPDQERLRAAWAVAAEALHRAERAAEAAEAMRADRDAQSRFMAILAHELKNPLNAIYGTMTILVVSTVTHFYTVAHLTAMTALKQMDPEFESVAASLKQPFHRLFFRVTVPVCLPAILNIAIYLFVNAMTTVSAVVSR